LLLAAMVSTIDCDKLHAPDEGAEDLDAHLEWDLRAAMVACQ
jgi:hypothetical protein